MQVAALYDVHGMADALAAVLADVEGAGVDAVVLGGDVVGHLQPTEALAPDMELRRTPFDVAAAAEAIRATSWPHAEAFVEENLERSYERASTIELFERLAAERGER